MAGAHTETLAGIELRSVPAGLAVLDALVKEAAVVVRYGGDIDPSRFLVIFDGDLSSVESALERATLVAGRDGLETLLLPQAHDGLHAVLRGDEHRLAEAEVEEPALGALQCHSVLGTIAATDRALKAAHVALIRLRLASELAGQGHAVLQGDQPEVEAALEAGRRNQAAGVEVETRLIARAALETRMAASQRPLGPRALRSFDP
jgi:microcompartment protein CcmL/EutN